jgi:hypothetical protein
VISSWEKRNHCKYSNTTTSAIQLTGWDYKQDMLYNPWVTINWNLLPHLMCRDKRRGSLLIVQGWGHALVIIFSYIYGHFQAEKCFMLYSCWSVTNTLLIGIKYAQWCFLLKALGVSLLPGCVGCILNLDKCYCRTNICISSLLSVKVFSHFPDISYIPWQWSLSSSKT